MFRTELNMMKWTQLGIVAKEQGSGKIYSKIDFQDLEIDGAFKNHQESGIILNLRLAENIKHTFPPINRCCRSIGKRIKFDGIDTMERIFCNISSEVFQKEYVDKRKPVILTGCQKEWKAKNWTFGSLLGRYVSKWPLSYYIDETKDCYAGQLSGTQIYHLMKHKVYFKSFTQLPKSRMEQMDKSEKEFYKLDLLDEFAYPSPFPRDELEEMNLDTNQAYVMLSSDKTGLNYSTGVAGATSVHTWASLKESKGYTPQKNFRSRLLPLRKGTLWQNIPPPLLEKFEPKIQRVPPLA